MLNPYSADDAALRALARADRYAAQRRYAALSIPARRAFAIAHPDFVAGDSSPFPESLRFAMLDAEATDGPDAAQALFHAHIVATTTARAAADTASQRMPLGERIIMAGAYTFAACIVAAVVCPTGYVAAGPHGALVGFTAIACTWLLAITYRIMSGSR